MTKVRGFNIDAKCLFASNLATTLFPLLPAVCCFVPLGAQAQVVPDATLPVNSNVTPSGNTSVINGGTTAGSNLFHSFEQFSLPTGSAAYFNNGGDIQNIISRVTGGFVSNIDGLMRANGTANLFLLNPNGIIFGSNASLSIGGSFLASTADSIHLADGTQFSATKTQTAPLLTVNVPVGLGFGSKADKIVNRSQGFQVQSGQTLALVGGDILLEGGRLSATDGRISVGSVAGNSVVTLTPTNPGWLLSYEGVQNFQDIRLTQTSAIDTSGSGGGNIHMQGRHISLRDGSVLYANTRGVNSGGSITVQAPESLELIGTSPDGFIPSSLFASVQPGATGKGGNVTIETRRLSLVDGGELGTGTWSTGDAGDLTVRAKDIEMIGGSAPYFQFPSGLYTRVQAGAAGNGGDVTIETDRLRLADGARIEAGTLGAGNGGNLTVRAKDIELSGTLGDDVFPDLFPTILLTQVDSIATGRGGNVEITTNRLQIRDGAAIAANTLGAKDAGNVSVTARVVDVIGTSRNGTFPSSLSAASSGNFAAGFVSIAAESLSIRNGAEVSVSSLGSGGGGRLNITADSLHLDNAGSLRAEVNAGNQGNIGIEAGTIQLLRGSTITATAGGTGNGGNLTINSDTLVTWENSDITANAVGGNGGRIQINTQGLFQSPDSEIMASSQMGISGTVQINTLDINPTRVTVAPVEVLEIPSVSSVCQGRSSVAASEFIITGTGGIPPSPDEPLNSNTGWHDNSVHAPSPQNSHEPEQLTTAEPTEIVEAQGWRQNPDGTITLTAEPNTVVPYSSLSTLEC